MPLDTLPQQYDIAPMQGFRVAHVPYKDVYRVECMDCKVIFEISGTAYNAHSHELAYFHPPGDCKDLRAEFEAWKKMRVSLGKQLDLLTLIPI